MKPESTSFSEYLNIASGVIIVMLVFVVIGMMICWPRPVEAKSAALPTQLDLGGVAWKVDLVPYPGNSQGFIAYTACEVRRIQIRNDDQDHRETLIHEILHAYTCQDSKTGFDVENFYYNSKTENGHEGYDRIGMVVADAMLRNPSLAAYLSEGKN